MFKKLGLLVLTTAMTVSMMSGAAYAEDDFTGGENSEKVYVEIQGIDNMIYSDYVVGNFDSVTEVLKFVDTNSEEVTATITESTYGSYLVAINGDTAGCFGGWGGWLYMMNGTEPSDGMDYMDVNDGDSIVFYYADPYGVGFQKPYIDAAFSKDGVIRVVSDDTIYDENWNASVVKNPVVGATVTWFYGDKNVSYVTDDNGEFVVDAQYYTEGVHKLSIDKKAENGAPMVLRWSNMTWEVEAGENQEETTTESSGENEETIVPDTSSDETTVAETSFEEATTVQNTEDVVNTGDNVDVFTCVLLLGTAGVIVAMSQKKKEN